MTMSESEEKDDNEDNRPPLEGQRVSKGKRRKREWED